MAEYQIRDLKRVTPETGRGRSYWQARLVMGDHAMNVDTRSGSWLARFGGGFISELRPDVAAALADKVRPLEKAEKRERESVSA